MPNYKTLHKGDLVRRVESPAEYRQLKASGWSEKQDAKVAAKPAPKPVEPKSENK